MTVGNNLLSHLSDMSISANHSRAQVVVYRYLSSAVPSTRQLPQYIVAVRPQKAARSNRIPPNSVEREAKRSLSQALTSNEAPSTSNLPSTSVQRTPEPEHDNLLDNRPNKCPRLQRKSYVTIYVKKPGEKIYSALCLSKPTLDVVKEELARKYSIPTNMVAKFYKRTKKGLLIHMDNRMVEQWQDEDDFNIEISFQNKEGIFEVTFIY